MARKKKTDRPKHVSIYYDQILYDLDFMPDEYAGIILKMIVWYASGTKEGEEHIAQMKERIDTLHDKGWLTGIYRRLFGAIDEDFSTYAEICEKRRQAVAKREEYKRNQMISSDNKCNQMISSDNLTDTDTDTDTDVPKGTDKNNKNIDVDDDTHACEGNLIDSKINKWHNADIVTRENIPELTDVWIEEIKNLVRRFNQKELTDEDVHRHYEDFKAQENNETLQESYTNWRRHFNNFIRKRIKRQDDERDIKANQEYNSSEARAKRQEGYLRVMQKLHEESVNPKKKLSRPF